MLSLNNQTVHSPRFTEEDFDSSLFDLCFSSMNSNAKEEDTKSDLQWVEDDGDMPIDDTDDVFKPDPAPVKATNGVKKLAKGPPVFQKYKKAPNAPRRFKSAFIFFSIEKHRSIRELLESGGQKEKTTNVAKRVSQAWKGLSKEERQVWDEKARKDRARYEVEVANYRGPWKVLATRAKKPSDAPKRPMSAFLSFSNKRRKQVMQINPFFSQSEISALLSKMWKEAPEDVRGEYTSTELVKRNQYKQDIALWREKDKAMKQKQRAEREATALELVDRPEQNLSHAMLAPSRGEAGGFQKAPADFASSTANGLSLARAMAHHQTPECSFSFAQSVARIARQQDTLQQLSSVYHRQQETLHNLAAASHGRPQLSTVQPISLSHNLSLHNQRNIALELTNLRQLGGSSIEEAGLDLADFNQQYRDGGMYDWGDFAMGE